jgi:hypothetical protein
LEAPFSASETKIARARAHLAELQSEIASYLTSNPVTVKATVNTTGDGIEVFMSHEGVPEIIGAIVGDVVHNLQTSLDLAACDLVRLQGDNNVKDVYFPFCDNPNGGICLCVR